MTLPFDHNNTDLGFNQFVLMLVLFEGGGISSEMIVRNNNYMMAL